MTENTAALHLFNHISGANVNGGVFISYSNQPQIQAASVSPQAGVPDIAMDSTECIQHIQHLKPSEVYAGLLLPQGRGYPLWKPKQNSSHLPEQYKQDGVHIGDVGILDEFGGFEFLFNACHPADHPLNAAGVPPDFKHLEIDQKRVNDNLNEFQPGTAVASESSHFYQNITPYPHGQPSIPGVPEEVGAGLSFYSSATKGALLILPEGAKRTDHLQYMNFAEHAATYGYSWYSYVNGPLKRGVYNGALYFITGYDKACAWGVASFKDAQRDVHLEYLPKAPTKVEGPPKYWFRSDFASRDCGDDVLGYQSGSVFLRGFKITLQNECPLYIPLTTKVQKIQGLDADRLLPTGAADFSNGTRPFGLQQTYTAPRRLSNINTHAYSIGNQGLNFNFPPRSSASVIGFYFILLAPTDSGLLCVGISSI
ncbi:hypothetical protein BT96DRAFT_458508 [Gymnopus androsaceus JB14]|uniref:Uncharacterized protein n=1 Tax=Gymnopus androsaceus JB14 TaxID=1447944 RepID=A0A6A4IJM4_9AGAR|nr:hypothetical protein BT96DRAFT_458508 [Gymnopus androsaceus JB14]